MSKNWNELNEATNYMVFHHMTGKAMVSTFNQKMRNYSKMIPIIIFNNPKDMLKYV
jgi:hypothetical protein